MMMKNSCVDFAAALRYFPMLSNGFAVLTKSQLPSDNDLNSFRIKLSAASSKVFTRTSKMFAGNCLPSPGAGIF